MTAVPSGSDRVRAGPAPTEVPVDGPIERADPAVPAPALIRVLLVEDNAADADLVAELLHEASSIPTAAVAITHVERLSRAIALLAAVPNAGSSEVGSPDAGAPEAGSPDTVPFDVVLLDLSLPDARRLDGVLRIGATAPGVPIVVMTGLADEQVALEAMSAGAQDYLVKGQGGGRDLRRAIAYAIERHRLRRERRALLEREREARAVAERAVRARDEVLAVVAHDLRNPLSAISINATVLLERTTLPTDEAAELQRAIRNSARSALHLIRDLLDVTRIEAGYLVLDRRPVPVAVLLDTIAAMHRPVAATKGVQLTVAAAADLPPVAVDDEQLVRALGNLVDNAIKFTPTDGHVFVSAAHDARAGRLLIRVADTGPGIAPRHLPHLFDRFWQAHESRRGGSGLGLAIAKGIVEAHGGAIDVASVPGAGATFTLAIPLAGRSSVSEDR